MDIKKKILSKIALMIIVSAVVTMAIVIFNFRSYGIDVATQKAEIVAELVKNGLTSHMLNGTMDSRDNFLQNLSQINDVESLWVMRADVVNKQFGEPRLHEVPRDDIDRRVLQSGEKEIVFYEELDRATLRVTIPYIAEVGNPINCFKCHDASQGETLGAISMEFDVMSIRKSGIAIAINILLITAIAILVILFFTSRSLSPYLELFESLRRSLSRASAGDFSDKITSKLSDEAGNMVSEYDQLLDKLDSTFGKIDKNLKKFVTTKGLSGTDPLGDAEQIVTSLSNLYQFKKAIELDLDKSDIYARLQHVIVHYHNIKNFSIIEIDRESDSVETVLQSEGFVSCAQCSSTEQGECRARRTRVDIFSDEFPYLCECFRSSSEFHICIPINIRGKVGVVIHLTCEEQGEFEDAKDQVEFIKNYANEAIPVIESRRLLEILKESSLKDALTGLYNRRFLDEYIDKIKAMAHRSEKNVGILMIDMDHFKMVNDSYGHDVGDIVLRDLSEVLVGNIRESDIAVRFGGEEFVVLLMDIDSQKSAVKVAQKIRQSVEDRSIDIGDGKSINKSVSIGVSIFGKDSLSLWQSIKFADVALYQAKLAGRNRVVKFDPSMSEDLEKF